MLSRSSLNATLPLATAHNPRLRRYPDVPVARYDRLRRVSAFAEDCLILLFVGLVRRGFGATQIRSRRNRTKIGIPMSSRRR